MGTTPVMNGREFGSKPGSAGPLSGSQANVDRRERLRQLALQTIDLKKDPYFMKNHIGTYECKLCLTLHNTEGNYLAHTQGKRHQQNLRRRAAREAKMNNVPMGQAPPGLQPASTGGKIRRSGVGKKAMKFGRPGYKVTKQRDPETGQRGLLFQITYTEIAPGVQPRHCFMSSYEQKIEHPDKNYQFVIFAAEPYHTIAFKVPNIEIERDVSKLGSMIYSHWDREKKIFTLRILFKQSDALEPEKKDLE